MLFIYWLIISSFLKTISLSYLKYETFKLFSEQVISDVWFLKHITLYVLEYFSKRLHKALDYKIVVNFKKFIYVIILQSPVNSHTVKKWFLGYETNLKKFKRIEIIQSMSLDNGIKPEINNRKIARKQPNLEIK